MNGRGFLGTNASLTSDLSLVIGVLVAVLLTVGVTLAVKKKFHAHGWIQSTAVVLNVLQVLTVMVGSFSRSAAPGIPSHLDQGYYAVAMAHGLVGLTTLLLGVFIAIRANELLPPFLHFLRFHNFKLFMRTAYGLYLLSTALGVSVYVIWYVLKPQQEPATTALEAQEVLVPMQGFAFNPEALVVPVGSTIVWLNQDGAPHTATADDGHSFASDLITNGHTFRLTVSELGDIAYFCELHGSAGGVGMSGTIRVVAQGAIPTPVAVAAAPTQQPEGLTKEEEQLPRQAFTGIHQLLVEGPGLPLKEGYVVGLKDETQEMQRHASLLVQSQAVGDLAGVRRHAEHVFNLVVGALDPDFGDLDGDGHAQNAGDGFGLLVNGDQPGYIRATSDAATLASTAADATPTIKLHAGHVRTSTQNMQDWAQEARGLARELSRVTELPQVDRPATRLLTVAKWLSTGNEANADGEISPIAGEAGALVAYEHAHYMANTISTK